MKALTVALAIVVVLGLAVWTAFGDYQDEDDRQ